MSDDPKKKGPADRTRISLGEDYEVRYWTEKFGVSKETLQAAIHQVGNSTEKVAAALAKKRSSL
jgi:predicted DNA-binding protein (UPF0251 family)